MIKILADRNIVGADTLFGQLGEVLTFSGREIDSLAGVDVLLVRSVTRVDDSLLDGADLQFVGTATSGYDHVDCEALRRRDIPFAHAPGSNADSVVDYVLSALANSDDQLEKLLAGAALGIVGYGNIGRRLHQRLQAIGIRCLAYDPWLSGEEYTALTDLETLLGCPVVSVHAALTDARPWPSRHMLSAAALADLPESGLLINAGRGELIARAELLTLADNRPDLQLVLDVWEGEPRVDADLLSRARFGTAHIAGYSLDGKLRATEMLFRETCRALGHLPAAVGASPGRENCAAVDVEVPDLDPAAVLRWLLLQVYDIREDDRLLRDSLPDSFDVLRKGYRRRRELGCLRIANPAALCPESRAMCEALGLELAPC